MELLYQCPECGNKLLVASLCQYRVIHEISESGKQLAKIYKKEDLGPEYKYQVYCENKDFMTDYEGNIIRPEGSKDKIICKKDKFYLL